MTDTSGSDYIAEYTDGPLAGQIEHRTLEENGETEKVVNAMVAVDGLETILQYHAGESREVEGVMHVAFSFDAKDSDTIEPDESDVNDETASSI